jgi:hypothetical protein
MEDADMETDDDPRPPELPDELLQVVMMHADDPIDLLRFARVSRSWRRVAGRREVWRRAYRNRWLSGARDDDDDDDDDEDGGFAYAFALALDRPDTFRLRAPTDDASDEDDVERIFAPDPSRKDVRALSLFNRRVELEILRTLDDAVWPTARARARERLRRRLIPSARSSFDASEYDDNPNADEIFSHACAVARWALRRRVGWDGSKPLSRARGAAELIATLVEFEVAIEMGDLAMEAMDFDEEEYRDRNVRVNDDAETTARASEEMASTEEGLAHVARLLDHDLDPMRIHACLDKIGAEFKRRLDESGAYAEGEDGAREMRANPRLALEILNAFLFDDEHGARQPAEAAWNPRAEKYEIAGGDLMDPRVEVPRSGGLRFVGNGARYYDPENSSLASVLRRRVGIPITLSVVYAAVARRGGLTIRFLNVPGHFVCGVASGARVPNANVSAGGEISIIDVFNQGATTDPVSVDAVPPELLRRTPPPDVCFRALNNLRVIFQRHDGAGKYSNAYAHRPEVVNHSPRRRATLYSLFAAMRALQPVLEFDREAGKIALEFGHREDALECGVDPADVDRLVNPATVALSNTSVFDRAARPRALEIGAIVVVAPPKDGSEARWVVCGFFDVAAEGLEDQFATGDDDPDGVYYNVMRLDDDAEERIFGVADLLPAYKDCDVDLGFPYRAPLEEQPNLVHALGAYFESYDPDARRFVPHAFTRYKYGYDAPSAAPEHVR